MAGIFHLLLGRVQQAVASAVDPFFNYVTALLHGDGTNGAQNNTFLDSSTNNFTITRNGNTTQGTFSPFSQTGWSNYFDGSSDYLSVASATALNLSTGDFTIECWVYPITGINDVDGVISKRSQSTFTGGDWRIAYRSASTAFGIACGTNNTDRLTPAIALNQWNHIAFVRSSGTLSCYANGLRGDSLTWTDNLDNVSSLLIGLNAAGFDFPGYISNVRIVKGTAVYSGATYTVPTTPLTAITNTSLLTCQSNRFLDASSNNFTVTPTGDTSVQAFSPFNPTSAWSASSNGGSGYFDGSGDYLTVAANTAFDVSASAYTFETWVYFTTAPSVTIMFGLNGIGISGYANLLYSGGTLYWQQRGTSTNQTTYTWSPTLGQWYHIAIGWNGSNSLAMWINGTRVATNTVSPTGAGQNGINFGAASDGYAVGGYMSNFRLVKGTDVYGVGNATITVPTAPLTAISNTSFLLNFTNAGIYDNAAVGDYETVGNAQVSTSVVKYGTGSMYFDGTGDYLVANTPVKNVYALGAGDFTIECWVYFNSISNTPQFISGYAPPSTTTYNWAFYLPATGTLAYYLSSTGTTWDIANGVSFGTTFTTGVWYHIALVRVGGKITPYVNGTAGTSTTSTATIYNNNGPIYVGGISTYVLNGYIDDFRFTKGIGRYPYNFTPPTAAFPNIGGTVTLTADPYFRNTTLLLPGNGTNGAQNNTFLDSSSNAFTITRNGNTTQGTFTPFSQTGWSNYFDGTGDYLTVSSSAAFGFGTGDFTIEGWLYPTANPTNGPGTFFDLRTGATATACSSRLDSSFNLRFYDGPLNSEFNVGTVQLNTWTHVAFVRSSGSLKTYINGTLTNTTTVSSDLGSNQPCMIGNNQTAGYAWNGYQSNFRIVKGTAVYTANFTPSATPLTAITNTSLLTCQSNRFIDNSSNAFAITRNGDTSVQAFSPFAPTAAYSASTVGGSGYFDGSGDRLSIAGNSAFDISSGDFTVEGWVYPTSSAAAQGLFVLFTATNSNYAGMTLYVTRQTSSVLLVEGASPSIGGGAPAFSITTTNTASVNTWTHVAITRSGNTFTVWINGVSNGTATFSGTLYWSPPNLYIGSGNDSAPNPFAGYISSFRIVKGTAVYTAAFTPPTLPVTAISGTQVLTNFTNGGITDATAKNDLETVGNAQISTTQSKFGGSSMLFNGTTDYLTRPGSTLLDFGTSDFTIEAWVYPSATQTQFANIVCQASTGNSWYLSFGTSNAVTFSTYATVLLTSSVGLSNSTWTHVAVTRYGTSLKMFFNGIQVASATDSTSLGITAKLNVGFNGSLQYFNGYIDDLRITKGIARYTSNFTPPTSAFLLQ